MSHNLRIPRFIAFSRLFQSDVKVKILLNSRHVLLFYVSAPCLLLITYSFFGKWKVLRWYAYQVRMINISFLVTNFELLKVFLPAETLIKDWFWVGFFFGLNSPKCGLIKFCNFIKLLPVIQYKLMHYVWHCFEFSLKNHENLVKANLCNGAVSRGFFYVLRCPRSYTPHFYQFKEVGPF